MIDDHMECETDSAHMGVMIKTIARKHTETHDAHILLCPDLLTIETSITPIQTTMSR